MQVEFWPEIDKSLSIDLIDYILWKLKLILLKIGALKHIF